MENGLKSDNFGFSSNDEENAILNSLSNSMSDRNVTEEEFQNFMHRVTEVGEYTYIYAYIAQQRLFMFVRSFVCWSTLLYILQKRL